MPKQLPDPLEEPETPRLSRDCPQGGAVVDVATSDGRTVHYGPCRRPDSIERLRLAMAASYRAYLSQRVPGAPPGTPAWLERLAWRAPAVFGAEVVLGDIDDETLDGTLACMAKLLWSHRHD